MTATMSGQVDVGWAGAPFGVAELEARAAGLRLSRPRSAGSGSSNDRGTGRAGAPRRDRRTRCHLRNHTVALRLISSARPTPPDPADTSTNRPPSLIVTRPPV